MNSQVSSHNRQVESLNSVSQATLGASHVTLEECDSHSPCLVRSFYQRRFLSLVVQVVQVMHSVLNCFRNV
jgi:hypothetical protein